MTPCPIWGETYPVEMDLPGEGRTAVVLDSPRAGGGYTITGDEKRPVEELTDAEKARLTTLLIDQRRSGIRLPTVTMNLIEAAKRKRPLEPYVRADRLLHHIADRQETVAHEVVLPLESVESNTAYAWSESTDPQELIYLIRYLENRG